jgi:HNH endonuclease
MPQYKPSDYVTALLALIQVSSHPDGPTQKQVSTLGIKVPDDWLNAILCGWSAYAKRYDKPYLPELAVASKPIRFLRIGIIPPMRLSPKPYCTLCALSVTPPRRSWHKECIEAFLPYTHRHWKDICRKVKIRAKGLCSHCRCKTKKFQFDHILAVGLGGKNTQANCSALCNKCHHVKTKEDVVKIKLAKLTLVDR